MQSGRNPQITGGWGEPLAAPIDIDLEETNMTNTGQQLAAMSFAALGLVQFLPVEPAFAQQRRTQPQESLMMYGVRTTPEISAKCEAFIDRTFGRGTGSEVHRSAGLAACIERGGN
jgi:hypothetical protein